MFFSSIKSHINPSYRRLLKYAFAHWRVFVMAILAMILVALTQPAFAALMEPILNGGFIEKDMATIRWVSVAVIVVFLVRAFSGFASDYGMAWVGRQVILVLRQEMFQKLMRLPSAYYDTNSTGATISRFTFDVEQLAQATTTAITILVRDFIMVISLIAYMFYVNARLALVFLVIGPVIAFLVSLVSRRIRLISRRIQQSMGQVSHVVEEAVQANRVVKIFGGQEYELRQFYGKNKQNRQQQMKLVATSSAAMPVIQIIVAFALAGIIYYASLEGVKDNLNAGTFISFLTAMMMLFAPIKHLTNVNTILQRGIAAAESIFSMLDADIEMDRGDYTVERVQGAIEFKQLGFSYPGHAARVLKDISLDIKPGQTVAFVGKSGSGKSTLVNLLPRLYDNFDGELLLDGIDIRRYALTCLRDQIAYVGQEIVLFNDSIAHNIAYGRLHDVEQDIIIDAARSAHAWEFIERMPEGLQTMVGEKGVMLSGGQRQRIAIARALLKNAPVLIMDEATSALDTESERHIQAALEELLKNRTTLVIAHRLSTIENADLIVVMDNGCIVETGTHQQLLEKNGHYAGLHRLQFSESALKGQDATA